MNGLETAIRNALARSDRSDPEVRARIYQSARHALEAGLRKRGVDKPEVVALQRRRLEAMIGTIEAAEQQAAEQQAAAGRPPQQRRVEPGFSAPSEAAPPEAPMPQPEDMAIRAERRDAPQDGRHEPSPGVSQAFGGLRAERREPAAAPVRETDKGAAGDGPAEDVVAERAAAPRRRRGFFSRLFIYLVLAVFVVMGGWWLYFSDALLSPAERDTSVPNPPPRIEEEDYTGAPETPVFDPQNSFSGDWIEIFTPDQASKLRVGERARVEPVTTAGDTALRIVSSDGGEAGDVRLEVPVDVLRQMAGKTSTIALTLQSATSEAAQISVQCGFGSLGSCDRHRFTANQEKFDALFQVEFPRALTPSTPGLLLINTGLGGTGRGIDLFSVRILPGA